MQLVTDNHRSFAVLVFLCDAFEIDKLVTPTGHFDPNPLNVNIMFTRHTLKSRCDG
jgi:hypothetical protein